MNYNGKYLYLPANDKKKACFVQYKGGSKTENWLNFCYDHVAPESRLVDIVSVRNHKVPLAFRAVDIIVDDEGLFASGGHPEINSFASFLYGNILVGDALLGYVAYDSDAEGDHVFPLSEHPNYAFLASTVAEFLSLPFIPDKKED